MAHKLADRVEETSTTTGTGTLNLDGAIAGYQTFVAGIGTGNTTLYCITDGTDWEVGLGTVTDATPDTLSRDTILKSSNADAAVNWGAGTRRVFCTFSPSGKIVFEDNIGIGVTPLTTWSSGLDVLQMGLGGYVFSTNSGDSDLYLGSNAELRAASWNYINTDAAVYVAMYDSEFYIANAPSGTAGNSFTPTTRFGVDNNNSLRLGATSALATTATDGFIYVPTCAGTPTGTPTSITGLAPIVIDTTNNKLYFYSGGAWRDAGP